jgi:hypothetical protein
VRNIGNAVFGWCESLPSVTIPNGVTSIGEEAFICCNSLNSVTFKGDAPKISENAFEAVTATCYYPNGNSSWTANVKQNYSGTLTWDSYFPDVPANMWCYEAVEFVSAKGYITGYQQSGNFGPADKITRQDFVVVLARISGVDLKKYSGRTSFPDVKAGSYYEAAVKWASANGIVNGYSNGKFGVGDQITREQMVTILYNYAKKAGYDVSVPASAAEKLKNYTDAYKITGYARPAVIWALHKGVISGMTATTIAPQNSASRGQAATIFMNISKKHIMDI